MSGKLTLKYMRVGPVNPGPGMPLLYMTIDIPSLMQLKSGFQLLHKQKSNDVTKDAR